MNVLMVRANTVIGFEEVCNEVANEGYIPTSQVFKAPEWNMVQQWIKPKTEREQTILEQRLVHV